MADGLIIPNVARYTINGTYADQPVANVLDMAVYPVVGGTPRNVAVAEQAGRIVSAWSAILDPYINNRYTATSVEWLDMASESGTTGSTTVGPGLDFPQTGASTGHAMPGNVSYRFTKNIAGVRGSRKGRMYVAGVNEEATVDGAPNSVIGDYVTNLNTEMVTFLNAISNNGSGDTYISNMVVVHTHINKLTGALEYVGQSNVTSLTLDGRLASQRRRLR